MNASRSQTGGSAERPEPIDAALVICGHGSHLNPDSSAPVYDHAARLREEGDFAEVREAFWKEEPSLRNALRTVESEDVIVVPLFTSEGYFTEGVIPRELRLDGGGNSDDGEDGADGDWSGAGSSDAADGLDVRKRVWYADPVGTHSSMTDAIVARAERIAENPDVGPETGLAVIGHGTERNPKSAKATRDHAARIRERDRFAASEALFMDQEPFVENVLERFDAQRIVAVPLFIADGFHTREEIPELLGLAGEFPDYENPSTVEGREIRYAGAVGTDPSFASVIAERAREAFAGPADVDDRPSGLGSRSPDRDEDGSETETSEAESEVQAARGAFLKHVEREIDANGAASWGELLLSVDGEAGSEEEGNTDEPRTYELRHADDEDVDAASLEEHTDPSDAKSIARFDDEGEYRPLKSAPTLAHGWRLVGLDSRDLYRAVSGFYPASIANWYREQRGTLDVTHYAETAARQTGMYDPVDELEGKALDRAAEACCADDVCLKRRVWESGETDDSGEDSGDTDSEGRAIDAPPGDGKIPCREPCSLFIAAAREFALAEREEAKDSGGRPRDSETEHTTLTETDRETLDAILAGLDDREGVESVRPGEASDPRNHYRVRYLRAKLRDLDGEEPNTDDRATTTETASSSGGGD